MVMYECVVDVVISAYKVCSANYSIELHFLGALNRKVSLKRILRVRSLQCQDTLILLA